MKVESTRSCLGDVKVTFSWNEDELQDARFDPIDRAQLDMPQRSVADWALDVELIARRIEQASGRRPD